MDPSMSLYIDIVTLKKKTFPFPIHIITLSFCFLYSQHVPKHISVFFCIKLKYVHKLFFQAVDVVYFKLLQSKTMYLVTFFFFCLKHQNPVLLCNYVIGDWMRINWYLFGYLQKIISRLLQIKPKLKE